MAKPIIQVSHVAKKYQQEEVVTTALADVSFTIDAGEFVAIIGPSGSGKSTLMHILGALDTPTSGSYILDGANVEEMDDNALAEVRNRKIGFVFQAYNLLPRTTALKNVMLPMGYGQYPPEKRAERAKYLLGLVGLQDRIFHSSNQLSGGQQQRVAIARSLAMEPALLLADEPTGNLATAQSEEIMDIFHHLNRQGHTIIMITHEPAIAAHAKRVIELRDGEIVSDRQQTSKKERS